MSKSKSKHTKQEELPGLRCLRGAPPPRTMADDLMTLLELSKKARAEFGELIGAFLGVDPHDDPQRAIGDYCHKYDLEPSDLAPAIKAAVHLLRESARANIARKELSADVNTLIGDDHAGDLEKLLLGWFEKFQPELRTEAVRQSVLDHGKLVVDTHWRMERITSSDRGEWLNTKVAVLTFNYREGDDDRRVTLHLLPEQVMMLRDAASEMLE
jgi:hypothetical protein